jgi:hypothetical protein
MALTVVVALTGMAAEYVADAMVGVEPSVVW